MGIIDFFQSEKGKKITGCMYSLGASVVIVGALFKIQHWPGAGPMLCVGMFTEAILFGIGVFDKPHKEFDWSIVYPELEGGEAEGGKAENTKNGVIAVPEVDPKTLVEEQVKKLAESVSTLNTTATQIGSIASAASESQEYVNNLNKATQAASAFAASQASLTSASDNLVASYQNIASSIGAASNGSQNFAQQMDGITKNISTINSVFELQVRTVNEQNEAMKSLAGAVNKIQSSLENSAQSAADYQQQIASLANNLKQLNNVYGGMLNAMTIR
ncbi:MAG: gliding motility protein GldL [Paludibacteraceae bacterium]|jgi:gliding motility-associated protein GldL|nr:gliding motility protein GldL [Paludibacteraceae bacterium]MBR6043866.1 gliding motility protein GldL [Paludibacteraceae bacterium]MCR5568328.1 gliding motility protein GldL [Paludibacteraceae bacterium]